MMKIHPRFFQGLTLADMQSSLRGGNDIISGFGPVFEGRPNNAQIRARIPKGSSNYYLGFADPLDDKLDALEGLVREGLVEAFHLGNIVGVQIENEDGETYGFESHEVLSPEIAWKEYDEARGGSEDVWVINPILPGEIEGCTVID